MTEMWSTQVGRVLGKMVWSVSDKVNLGPIRSLGVGGMPRSIYALWVAVASMGHQVVLKLYGLDSEVRSPGRYLSCRESRAQRGVTRHWE